jgi:prepilin peptidase CpaA
MHQTFASLRAVVSDTPAGLAFGILFVTLVGAAMVVDVRERRIPNALSVVLLLGGVAFCAWSDPLWPGVRHAALGVGVGFGIWIVFYALGALGAGDVKFFAAASAWFGPSLAWRAALAAALFGGILAGIVLLRRRRLATTLRAIALLPATRSLPAVRVHDVGQETAHQQLPYGVALGLGAILAFLYPEFLT